MKHIDKGEPPRFFSDFVGKNHPKEWGDTAAVRAQLRDYILENEQSGCCAYTEIRIVKKDKCHIDHFRKRDLFPQMTMDYRNMLVACNSECYGAKYKDKNVTKADYAKLINPVEDNPSDFLEFTFIGEIQAVGNDKERGDFTINCFNLNERSLVEQRRQAVTNMLIMKEYLSEDEVVEAIGAFETMIRQLYKAADDAPDSFVQFTGKR